MVLLKKAQTETIGLVVIVIILAFILIFALQFLTKDKGNELNERYSKLNADNLRSVILKTNLCNDVNIKDEIISCNDFSFTRCQDFNCEKLNVIIKEIIQGSVKNNYEFLAGNIKLNNGTCLNKDTISSSTQPLALTDINVSLRLC